MTGALDSPWARNLRASYHRSWLLDVPASAFMLGPNNVAWLETALRCLSAAPLSQQEKLSTHCWSAALSATKRR